MTDTAELIERLRNGPYTILATGDMLQLDQAATALETLQAENERLREALEATKKDLIQRADSDGTVSVGNSVWFKINAALGAKP